MAMPQEYDSKSISDPPEICLLCSNYCLCTHETHSLYFSQDFMDTWMIKTTQKTQKFPVTPDYTSSDKRVPPGENESNTLLQRTIPTRFIFLELYRWSAYTSVYWKKYTIKECKKLKFTQWGALQVEGHSSNCYFTLARCIRPYKKHFITQSRKGKSLLKKDRSRFSTQRSIINYLFVGRYIPTSYVYTYTYIWTFFAIAS